VGRATALLEQSLGLFRDLGLKAGIPSALQALGDLALGQGDAGLAPTLYQESLTLARTVGYKDVVACCLEGLAGVACATGQSERAARVYGAAAALRAGIGVALPLADRAGHERMVATARAVLGEDAYAAAWAAGQALPLQQAISEAVAAATP
jgi:hypothetical protein